MLVIVTLVIWNLAGKILANDILFAKVFSPPKFCAVQHVDCSSGRQVDSTLSVLKLYHPKTYVKYHPYNQMILSVLNLDSDEIFLQIIMHPPLVHYSYSAVQCNVSPVCINCVLMLS